MAFTGLQQAQTHFGFLLYIDGIPEVYYSGGVAPTVSTTWPYVATPGLQEWRPESQTISPQSGIVEGGGGTVVIAETRGNGAQARLLKRRGGTTLQVTLKTTIEQGFDNTTVTVNEDNSAWPASGELWIGQECMHYTSRDSGAKTFTVPAAGRGYYSSRVQRHVADAERGWAPRITSAPVAWKNRAARLFVYQLQPSGAWSTDFVQECNGYIASSPKGGRRMIEIRLAPWSEFVKRKVGGTGRVTTLVSGAHVFDGSTLSVVTRGELWRQGAVMSTRANSASAGVAVVNDVVWEAHSDVYDPAGTGEPGYLVVNRLGFGSIDIAQAPTGYVGSGTDGTGDISLAAVLTSNVNANDLVENAETDLERQVQIYTLGSPVLMAWPGEALDTINTAWAPGTNKGAAADSAYADHRIIPHVEEAGGAAIRATVNSSVHRLPLQSLLDVRFNGDYTCWYGVNLADPSAEYDWNGLALAEHTLRRIDLHSKGGADSATPDIIPIVGMPLAFCQPPESYVYVRDNVFQDPTSATVFVRVKAQEWDGTDFETAFQVTAVETAASVLGGGEVGYLLTIAERDRFRFRAFGSWTGLREPTIYQMVQFNRYDPRVVLLELLTSEHGNAFWDPTYDVRPIGAGISNEHIDVNSFLRFPLPAGPGSTWSDDIGTEAIDLHEYLGRILTAINGVIVNRVDRSTGFRRLALVRAGSPLALESAGSITDGMWLTNGRPEDGVNEEIINSVKIRAGYNWSKREPGPPVVVNDADSIKENDRVVDAEYDLRGTDIDAASPGDLIAAVAPFAFEIFAQYGYEQPQARGRISYRDSLLLDPGSVITFSATDVIDTNGGEGVAGQVARILSMSRDPTRQTCEIMVQWDNISPTGWAPSMQVTAVIDADELTVAANAYSATTHPITGDAQTDVGFFAVGQKVRIVPAGAGFGVERTITAISGNDLTFDGAHGISSPDYGHIQPADYDDAATTHQAYAFQSDENGTLGASAVTGYDYG